MTDFWEVSKSAEHIRKINARKGKSLCKLKTMLADEQMGMKWAKNKSKLETGKFPAIWGMRSWNSLKGHECLTYSAILMRFECLNIWPGTTSCAALWMSFPPLFPFLLSLNSGLTDFPALTPAPVIWQLWHPWLDALPKIFPVHVPLQCYFKSGSDLETALCEDLKETLKSAVLEVWHVYIERVSTEIMEWFGLGGILKAI